MGGSGKAMKILLPPPQAISNDRCLKSRKRQNTELKIYHIFPTFVRQNAFDHTGCLSPIMIETSEIKTSLARFQNLVGTQSVLCP